MEEGHYGNPWILKQIADYLSIGGNTSYESIKNVISLDHRLNVIKEHLELLILEKGEYIAIREMRKHICWYLKNLKDSTKVRQEVNRLETKQEVVTCLTEYFSHIGGQL